ncbi:MAG: FAD-dependent monooxygenase, partial [Actinocatenispora sp.]
RGVYWYATLPGTLDERPATDQLARLRDELRDWHAPIPALLAATDPDDLLHHQITELRPPPRRFDHPVGSGGAVLVGDAAHAMTPNLGQGACQALEDAVTLGAVLPEGTGIVAGLARYHGLRYRRTTRLIQQSRRMALVLEMHRPTAVWLRDTMLSALPTALATRGVTAPARWSPPDGDGRSRTR